MIEPRRFVTPLVLCLASVTAACASPSGDEEPSAPKVMGVYEAVTAGPIVKLALAEGQYALVTKECGSAQAPCLREGRYALDAVTHELALTDGTTGETTRLPFAVVDAREMSSTTTAAFHSVLSPRGICLVGVPAGEMGACSDAPPAQLVTPGSPTTAPGNSIVVTCTGNCAMTVTVNGQQLTTTGQQLTVTVPAPGR